MGRHSKSESDIENDPHVADSRAGRRGDGSYVGRTAPEDDFDSGQTGAEARSEET
jgi:hypothetical protein